MPVTFHRYGRASTDKQVMSPEVQESMTRLEFTHQVATGVLPKDAICGNFVADKDVSRSIKFLHRPVGIELAMKMQSGDRLCVAAYDRLIGSSADACETVQFLNERKIFLVIMDLRLDTSTSHGQLMAEFFGSLKSYERMEIKRRTAENRRHLKEAGRPFNKAPLGWLIRKIIPAEGGRPIKWYFPYPAERLYGERIVAMRDGQGIGFDAIVMKLFRDKIVKPRSGKCPTRGHDAWEYYQRCKDGWPLPGGVQWKAPEFKYRLLAENVLDLTADCA